MSNEEIEDITEIEEPSKHLKLVKNARGEVTEVSQSYELEKGEEWVGKEEYIKYQEGTLKNIFKKAVRDIERKKTIVFDIYKYNYNVAMFYTSTPFFYDEGGNFWIWNFEESKYKICTFIDLILKFEDFFNLSGETIPATIKRNYVEAMQRIGTLKRPKEAPLKWIQFKDKAFSLNSQKYYDVKPNYFFTNPIPHELGESSDTPVLNKLFTEWVGEKNVQTLYEIIAYSCYRSYPIHLLFCFLGGGRNGKSSALKVMENFLGQDNITGTDLDDLLDSRFESSKLYRKLLCNMGETNFSVISKTSLLKKLTGQDLISFEAKHKPPFNAYNYAKIIISSNSLPPSEDNTTGFMRRWLILSFPFEFEEGGDIVSKIPKKEYNNLARKVCEILPKLIKNGKFTNQGTIEERKHKYIMASNPLPIFLEKFCEKEEDYFISYHELYVNYIKFLHANKRRRVKMKEFRTALEDEGFFIHMTDKKIHSDGEDRWKRGNWVEGIHMKDEFSHFSTIPTTSLLYLLYIENNKLKTDEKSRKTRELHRKFDNSYTPIYQGCYRCDLSPCYAFDTNRAGKPICEFCFKELYSEKEVEEKL